MPSCTREQVQTAIESNAQGVLALVDCRTAGQMMVPRKIENAVNIDDCA